MKTLKSLALAAAATAALTGAASATDLMMSETPAMTPAMAADGFDWQGFYDGIYGGGFDLTGGAFGIVGGWIGYNFMLGDRWVAGVEADGLYYLNGSGGWEVFANARLGYLVTDDVLLYKIAGIGRYSGGDILYQLGVGAEFAVTDNVTVRAQVAGHQAIGAPFSTGYVVGTLGAALHL